MAGDERWEMSPPPVARLRTCSKRLVAIRALEDELGASPDPPI
jgi:hypothetical protein